jgi:hypothetical protein
MTSPTADPVAQPATKPAALWEDFMDIFYAPSSVFKRRELANPFPAMIVISVLLLIIMFATYGATSGLVEGEIRRAMAKNPQVTQDQIAMGLKIGSWTTRLLGLVYPLILLVAALVVWLLSKAVSAKQSYQTTLMVVTYASVIDVVKALLTGAQALVMDTEKMTSINQLVFSPARFMDATTASPVMIALMNRLDVFTLWYTVLLGVGVYATGKVTKQRAMIFAVLYWALITAFALIGPLRAAATAG